MGWKHGTTVSANLATELSENQCGMETESIFLTTQQFLVEREPMWDGNGETMTLPSCFMRLSENQCGMETLSKIDKIAYQSVEREPMWDGNTVRRQRETASKS